MELRTKTNYLKRYILAIAIVAILIISSSVYAYSMATQNSSLTSNQTACS